MYFLIYSFILFIEIVYSSLRNRWKSDQYIYIYIYIYIYSKSEYHQELDNVVF